MVRISSKSAIEERVVDDLLELFRMKGYRPSDCVGPLISLWGTATASILGVPLEDFTIVKIVTTHGEIIVKEVGYYKNKFYDDGIEN